MSEEYTIFKNRFRRMRAEIEQEIDRRIDFGMKATDLMCVTWYVKQKIDRMRSDLDEHILSENTLSYRESRILYRYIDILDDTMWSILYNIAGKGVRI